MWQQLRIAASISIAQITGSMRYSLRFRKSSHQQEPLCGRSHAFLQHMYIEAPVAGQPPQARQHVCKLSRGNIWLILSAILPPIACRD